MVEQSNYNLAAVVEPACRIVAESGIHVIEVVPPVPFDRDKLRRLEDYAASRGVSLLVDTAGAIVLRGGAPGRAQPCSFNWRRWLPWNPSIRLPAGSLAHTSIAR